MSDTGDVVESRWLRILISQVRDASNKDQPSWRGNCLGPIPGVPLLSVIRGVN